MGSNPKNVRKCVACQKHDSKENLIRVCKTQDGYVIDKEGKMDGRGAYVHNTPECLKILQKKRGLNMSFKGKVPDEIYEELDGNK